MRTNFHRSLAPALLTTFFLCLFDSDAFAHKPSDSYLTLRASGSDLEGQWDLAVRDLDYALGLDADDDGTVTWGEVKTARPSIETYVAERLRITVGDHTTPILPTDLLVDEHSDGMYVVSRFRLSGSTVSDRLTVTYDALFDLDPQHRGLLRYKTGGSTQTAIFSPSVRTQEFSVSRPGYVAQSLAYVGHGIWHIWIGYDHILFLLTLLLPALTVRVNGRWQMVENLSHAGKSVLKIVTAFTLAHSLTLALAATGVVHLPSRWVESVIAASVIVAALLNLFPNPRAQGWQIAFGFGLIHGFGFAGVLEDLGLRGGSLVTSLVSFNLGVELGQLALVLVFIPLIYQLRRFPSACGPAIQLASFGIIATATVWMCERAFEVRLLP